MLEHSVAKLGLQGAGSRSAETDGRRSERAGRDRPDRPRANGWRASQPGTGGTDPEGNPSRRITGSEEGEARASHPGPHREIREDGELERVVFTPGEGVVISG